MLTFPDITEQAGEFVLDTDPPQENTEAVLLHQDQDHKECIIWIGCPLRKTDQNSPIITKEVLPSISFFRQYSQYPLRAMIHSELTTESSYDLQFIKIWMSRWIDSRTGYP